MTKQQILARLKRIYVRLDSGNEKSARSELKSLIQSVQLDVVKSLPPDQASIACELWGISDSKKG